MEGLAQGGAVVAVVAREGLRHGVGLGVEHDAPPFVAGELAVGRRGGGVGRHEGRAVGRFLGFGSALRAPRGAPALALPFVVGRLPVAAGLLPASAHLAAEGLDDALAVAYLALARGGGAAEDEVERGEHRLPAVGAAHVGQHARDEGERGEEHLVGVGGIAHRIGGYGTELDWPFCRIYPV